MKQLPADVKLMEGIVEVLAEEVDDKLKYLLEYKTIEQLRALRLIEDLNFDSLSTVNLVGGLEDISGATVPDYLIDRITTVAHVHDYALMSHTEYCTAYNLPLKDPKKIS